MYHFFISVDDLRTQMRQYTLEKNYSTLFGESVAYLVALALNITLRIYELINNKYRVTILNQAVQIGDIGEQNTPSYS